jgi:hypothetical protein
MTIVVTSRETTDIQQIYVLTPTKLYTKLKYCKNVGKRFRLITAMHCNGLLQQVSKSRS